MPDVHRVSQRIESPATLRVGGTSASEMLDVIADDAVISLPAVTANGIASASAAVLGMTTSHKLMAQSPIAFDANGRVKIIAAAAIANGIQVTAHNNSGSAIAPASATFAFFAWRNPS